ncbi:hypothetical protein QVD17_35137 [Tagetes erecta]|uniref:F-box protein n=1 Tax=Tagetes erecta TaxID=13708 RepID=A0AAD8K5B2_TARER|nr:hypothetical protein QVD17_35137 [Tagetes erecta]
MDMITHLHQHIIQSHILTKLDGRSLVVAGCSSSHLQSLCSDHNLWSNICSSNWPSTKHPLVTNTIVNFTSGHRSFFSDVFPSPSHHLTTTTTSLPTSHIISSIDLRYQNHIVFSKVVSTYTGPNDSFQSSPFRIDLLEPKELVQTELKVSSHDDHAMQMSLEKHMTLSWIMIDPIQNRAVNVSSLKPVSVQRNWLTDELELTFAIVMVVNDHEYVKCNVEVVCGVNGDGFDQLYVSVMSMTVQDINGKCLNGKDSMVILQGLMAVERRRCNGDGDGEKERYGEYLQRRKQKREEMEMRERRLDLVRVVCGVTFLMTFWSLALY